MYAHGTSSNMSSELKQNIKGETKLILIDDYISSILIQNSAVFW